MIFLRNFCFFFPRNVELTRESPNALLFESFEEKVVDVAKTLIGGVSDAPIRTVRGYKSKLIKEQKKKAAEEAAKKAKEAAEKARLEAEERAKGWLCFIGDHESVNVLD